MQHTFQHTIEVETHSFQPREIDLTIIYEYHPASSGTFPDDSTESRIEILSVTDANGKEYHPETIENINSLAWDHLSKTFEQ